MKKTRDKDYQRFISQGDEAAKARDAHEAVRKFTQAIRLRPDSAAAHVRKAGALRFLAWNYLMDRSIASRSNGRIVFDPEAERKKIERLGIAPGEDGEVLTAVYRQALDLYDRAIRLDGNRIEARALKAEALLEIGRCEEALEAIDEALQLNPENHRLLVQKTEILSELDRVPEALSLLDAALEKSPEAVSLTMRAGYALQDLKRHEEAADRFKSAKTLDPTNRSARAFLIASLFELERYGEALAESEEWLSAWLGDGEASLRKAHALRMLGRLEEAEAACEDALDRLERPAPAWYEMAAISALRGGDGWRDDLKEAFEAGYRDFARFNRDPAWTALRANDRFQRLLFDYEREVNPQAAMLRAPSIVHVRETDGA